MSNKSSNFLSKSKSKVVSYKKETLDRKREMFRRLGYSPKPIGTLINQERNSSLFPIADFQDPSTYYKSKTEKFKIRARRRSSLESLEEIQLVKGNPKYNKIGSSGIRVREPMSAQLFKNRAKQGYLEDKCLSNNATDDTFSRLREGKGSRFAHLSKESYQRRGERQVMLKFESSDSQESSSEEFDIKKDIMIDESCLY